MSSKAAIRYAKAVLQQANETKVAEVMFDDMKSVYATIQGSKELRSVLNSPVVKLNDKREALLSIFDKQSKTTKRLIQVLVDNKRIALLSAVASSYIDLYNESKGVKVAKVITAVSLTPALEIKILDKVKELTGSTNVTLNKEIDPTIIGGFILRVGDLQYNTSIANQLGNIKREFSKSL
jgi:F-type H+-transporting ATPase subunit delta